MEEIQRSREEELFKTSPHWDVEISPNMGEERMISTLHVSKRGNGKFQGFFRRERWSRRCVGLLGSQTFEGDTIVEVLRAFMRGVRQRYLTTLTDEEFEAHQEDVIRKYQEDPYNRELFHYKETQEFRLKEALRQKEEKRAERIRKLEFEIAKATRNLECMCDELARLTK